MVEPAASKAQEVVIDFDGKQIANEISFDLPFAREATSLSTLTKSIEIVETTVLEPGVYDVSSSANITNLNEPVVAESRPVRRAKVATKVMTKAEALALARKARAAKAAKLME